MWQASRGWSAAWLTCLVLNAVMPVVLAVAFGVLVGAIPDAAGHGLDSPSGHRLIMASTVAAAALLMLQAVAYTTVALNHLLGRRVEAQLQFDTLDALARASGLAELERPAVQEATEAARDVETTTPAAGEVVGITQVAVGQAVTAILAGAVLATFQWWAPLALMSGWTVLELATRRRSATAAELAEEQDHLRRYELYRNLGLGAPAAKELRLFGLGSWTIERADRHWRAGMRSVWHARRLSPLLSVLGAIVQLVANGLVFFLIVRAGVRGEISVERAAIYLQAGLSRIVAPLSVWAAILLGRLAPPLKRIASLASLGGDTPTDAAMEIGDAPTTEVRFEGVRFRYPGVEREVLAGIDLRIPAGRSVAIVGENGAGKTTLVKLLTRLYEPEAGTIWVDGRPLAAVDAAAWQQRIGVVFQDFVRYPFSLRENVMFGRWQSSADPVAATAACAAALDGAGLVPAAASFPDGVETILAREFGGTDLSGGQWQRVALARALYGVRQGVGLLILDEPTASLDVRAEIELFDRFLELTEGVTTVLISHRFSTVRRVDLIYVVEQGVVVEHGSHDELLARGGRYAEMFTLQAAPFTAGDAHA